MEYKLIKKKDMEPSDWNPRSEYDEEKLAELTKSIKGIGIVEPIIVRPHPTKKNKYLITAGKGRYDSFGANDEIDCIIRDEDELDAKISSLVENYVRAKVSDADHEKFISEIYEQGLKEGRWKTYSAMSKITGIPDNVISVSVTAFKDRQKLKLKSSDQRIVSTTDMAESRPLKDRPEIREKLLEKRAKGEIKKSGHIIHEMAKTLSKVPERVAKAVVEDEVDYDDVKDRLDEAGEISEEIAEPFVEELKKEKETIETIKKEELKADVEILKGEKKGKRLEIDKGKNEVRLEKFKRLYDTTVDVVNALTVDAITHDKMKKQAINYIKESYRICQEYLVQTGEIEVIDVKKS